MKKQHDIKNTDYREFFEKEVNTQEFQERVVSIAGKISSEESKNDIVKHMMSDDNINLKVKVARMAATQDPIVVARWLERFIIDLLVDDVNHKEEDITDEFGFQL